MKTILLGITGRVAMVDDDVFEAISRYKWTYGQGFGQQGYASRQIGGRDNLSTVLMHRQIVNARKHQEIDHINRNTLDNRRQNLRCATRSQNKANGNIYKTNKCGLKGVSFHKRSGKWMAQINVRYRKLYLGIFTDKTEAAKCYDSAALKHFGEFAATNKSLGLL